ncbi:MAG: hypothetical protein FJY56_18995 [Betaproteobacteria bacterium]|nr:hypothetical protein [Betaproteobacteria bacterium]
MPRRVFFSFHHQLDLARAAQVRGIGLVSGNSTLSDSDWSRVVAKGETIIQKWIDGQLADRECLIVLIGAQTAGRRGINYEIDKAWAAKKGVMGIYVHNYSDANGAKSTKGKNPFEDFTLKSTGAKLAAIVKAHDPLPTENRAITNYISVNLAKRVQEAIRIRAGQP